jgi:hypothetical protein
LSGQIHALAALSSKKEYSVGPIADLKVLGKSRTFLPGIEFLFLCSPVPNPVTLLAEIFLTCLLYTSKIKLKYF